MRRLLIVVAVLVTLLLAAAPASAANEWIESGEDAGPTYNCTVLGSPYYEPLGRAYTGWFGEIGVSPEVNDIYYLETGWGVTGNPCGTGGAGVHTELVLPAHTKLAISNQRPVVCFLKGRNDNSYHRFTGDCPQTPQAGLYGGYAFDPPGNQGPWPTASGAALEIHVPVKTSAPLNGIIPSDGTPCETCVYNGVWMIDGSNSPWVWPRQGVFVVGNGAPVNPSITYPGPAVTNDFYDNTDHKVHADFNANLFSEGFGGEVWFQGADQSVTLDKPGNDLTHYAVSAGGDAYSVYQNVEMTPGFAYHWRFCFRKTGASGKTCGPTQIYQAPPDTEIGKLKLKKTKPRKVTANFGSTTAGMTFQCKLDKRAYATCKSPKSYSGLKKGKHTLRVRARDSVGNRDRSPARADFKL